MLRWYRRGESGAGYCTQRFVLVILAIAPTNKGHLYGGVHGHSRNRCVRGNRMGGAPRSRRYPTIESGVTASELTSQGPVGEGSARHCDFAPLGGANERIDRHEPNKRLTVNLYETFNLPISGAIADFNMAAKGEGTELTIHYSYTPNLMGRLLRGTTDKQMRKGIGGLAKGLQRESERIAADRT
jgi:hypothetical protein